MEVETKRKWVEPHLYQTKQTSSQKMITRDKQGCYVMVKGSIHLEDIDIIIVNIYTLNIGALKYIKQIQ